VSCQPIHWGKKGDIQLFFETVSSQSIWLSPAEI
jgi:hypothetical protein